MIDNPILKVNLREKKDPRVEIKIKKKGVNFIWIDYPNYKTGLNLVLHPVLSLPGLWTLLGVYHP